VEAGARLNAALIEQGLVDELLVYMAPMLMGPGHPFAQLPALASLNAAPRLRWVEITAVGDDMRMRLRPAAAARSTGPVGGLDNATSY
jgi:diaminohydroxyphosphoribosylaminopyrimidine deaminase/5-amino-6-(5-phosphoribosylamino)uracil reductase